VVNGFGSGIDHKTRPVATPILIIPWTGTALPISGLQPAALALLVGLGGFARGSLRSLPLYSLRWSGILIRASAPGWAAAEAHVGRTQTGSDGRLMDTTKLELLYVANFSLLAVHEIDSAYWHEWELFGIPGGIQLFLVVNFALLVPFLYGLVRLVRSPRGGAPYGIALSVAGLGAFGVHTSFLVQGHPEFRLPASIAILGLTLLASLSLGWMSMEVLLSKKRRPTGSLPPG